MTVTDPDGAITALIIGVEPGLDADVVAGVLAAVAPGRNVRRRLAQALAERPGVLTDGRSPAPRVAGSLLIALRRAGRGESLGTRLHRLRQAAEHLSTARSGLVLRSLRSHPHPVCRMREHPQDHFAGSAGTTPLPRLPAR